jgi:hypothetical protein
VAVETEVIRRHQRVNQDLVKRRRKVYLLPHLADLTNVFGMLGIRPSTLNNPFIMASFAGHCPCILPSWALILYVSAFSSLFILLSDHKSQKRLAGRKKPMPQNTTKANEPCRRQRVGLLAYHDQSGSSNWNTSGLKTRMLADRGTPYISALLGILRISGVLGLVDISKLRGSCNIIGFWVTSTSFRHSFSAVYKSVQIW